MPDVEEARKQCKRFVEMMEHNRPNCDDSGVAKRILVDLDRYGQASLQNRRILTHWCHTKGSVYQRGVPIAKAICIALYGRILPRED
jgi:hypothetical protein